MYPRAVVVTHLSTNPAQRGITSLMRPTILSLSQTAYYPHKNVVGHATVVGNGNKWPLQAVRLTGASCGTVNSVLQVVVCGRHLSVNLLSLLHAPALLLSIYFHYISSCVAAQTFQPHLPVCVQISPLTENTLFVDLLAYSSLEVYW